MQTLTASTRGDSESDFQDQTPDTDDSGAHSYPEVSATNSLGGGGLGSFKRVPIMGNRGLEQRGKKTKTKDSPPVGFFEQSLLWFYLDGALGAGGGARSAKRKKGHQPLWNFAKRRKNWGLFGVAATKRHVHERGIWGCRSSFRRFGLYSQVKGLNDGFEQISKII